ncbi:MAG: aldose epimerase [Chloroflexi bacterium]|nr:MAG: aldose epimerase [Chloroflexota bacterium]TMD84512.1 MAG: aldose epimerase [Chloroflexota bacterium]
MAATPPSGRQYIISHGAQRAVITEVGGSLRAYTVDGEDVIDGYAEDEMCSAARGAPLLPWPNRLQDGRYEFAGVTHQTPVSEPERGNAIHGLTRWLGWAARDQRSDRVVMELLLHPQDGYPFTLSLALDYRLSERGLAVQTTATNAGSQALPYGAGHHPYLTVGTELIDDARLRIPALMYLEVDERQLPTGRAIPVQGSPVDFLELRRIGSVKLDTAFASLVCDADGLTRVELQAPGGQPRLTLWMDKTYRFLMAFTGDAIPQVDRRRRSVALEPMTCAPNAFRSGDGLIVLAPGHSVTSVWGILR